MLAQTGDMVNGLKDRGYLYKLNQATQEAKKSELDRQKMIWTHTNTTVPAYIFDDKTEPKDKSIFDYLI